MQKRFNVLGVGVDSLNMNLALKNIENWIDQGDANYVTVTGVHGVMESQKDKEILKIHNQAGMVTPDGMPLVWLGKLKGNKNVAQVCGTELMLAVCKQSTIKGYRHFLYGGNEGVPKILERKLKERFPGLNIVGNYSPPFRPLRDEEDEEILKTINSTNPDIVWIGLSTPKQERWMARHVGRLNAVMIGVGAAFDFNAGLKKRAPIWMQKLCLEWFYRLLSEPRRLWRRALYNIPKFILLIIQQVLGLKRYENQWEAESTVNSSYQSENAPKKKMV
jgi:N-acetylglucosaminyldiphosphoundecaprenol N-acetyl-beta-D-mannosaminyltransferase